MGLLSSYSEKRPIELSFSMTLSRAEFSSFICSLASRSFQHGTCASLELQETNQIE
jgi:hypothetical protein